MEEKLENMDETEFVAQILCIRDKFFQAIKELSAKENISDILVLYGMFAACFEIVKGKAEHHNLPPTILFADVEKIFNEVAMQARMIVEHDNV